MCATAHNAQLTSLYVATSRFVANDQAGAEHDGETVVFSDYLSIDKTDDEPSNVIFDGDQASNVAKQRLANQIRFPDKCALTRCLLVDF